MAGADDGPVEWETRFIGGSRFADGSAIIRPDQIQWTAAPWPDTAFKLTHIDRESGMWTVVLKVEAGAAIPRRHNFGEVQIYVLAGTLVTEMGTLAAGDYLLDPSGLIPERSAGLDGTTYFAMFAGGISDADAAGRPTGPYMDGGFMYVIAVENGAGDFLPAPNIH